MIFKDIQATINIDLNKSIEELWNNLDKDARWGVKRAIKEGLVFKDIPAKEWESFYYIYKETCLRGGIPPMLFPRLLETGGKLFGAYYKNQLIAGALVRLKDNKVILTLNSSLPEYLVKQPNNLLYWKIIEWSKSKGCRVFDLGGYQLNTKQGDKLYHINRFKERWGGQIKIYYVYSNNPFYILGRKVIRNFPKVKKVRDRIRLRIRIK